MANIIKNTPEIKKLVKEYLEEEWFKKLKELNNDRIKGNLTHRTVD
jgi:hypothetical protein